MWKRYTGTAQGVHVSGDPLAPPTKWWNRWYLALWGWQTVTVFEVEERDAAEGYMVGYRPLTGQAMVKSRVNHERLFAMRNGHEPCTFFAIKPNGNEVRLVVHMRTTINDVPPNTRLH